MSEDPTIIKVVVTPPADIVQIVDAGPQGPPGELGATGDSAYQVWLSEGNVGTESEFLADLQGAQGIQGEQGEVGPPGSTLASGVAVTPAGAIASVNVQAALEELDTEKSAVHAHPYDAAGAAAAAVTAHEADTTNVHGIVDTAALVTSGSLAAAVLALALTDFPAGLARDAEVTAAVNAAVAALVASAPGSLDTLDELAAALGDDANFATTVTNLLAAKAPLFARTTANKTTASLANLARESGTVTFTGAAGFRIFKVVTDVAARVRLYTTTAKRDADATRPLGTDATGDHGIILDLVTTASVLSLELSPVIDGYLPGAAGTVPYTIDNLSGATDDVTATWTYVRTE